MIELDDSLWKTLKGAYRIPYDASVRLRELEADPTNRCAIWKELWNELHHQGDIDLASYAAIPQLVRICISRGILDWDAFALVATIEECRIFGRNPPVPQWLEADYHLAVREFASFGTAHFSEDWSKELSRSFLAVAAFAKGLPKHGRILNALTDDELDEMWDSLFG